MLSIGKVSAFLLINVTDQGCEKSFRNLRRKIVIAGGTHMSKKICFILEYKSSVETHQK